MTPSAFDYEYIGKDGDWYCFQERGYGAPDSEKMKDFKKRHPQLGCLFFLYWSQ
jgi:hypothetical protein